MNYNYLHSIPIDPNFFSAASNLLLEPSRNFSALVKAAGLDPKFELVGTDLCGVNFSDCDLRGYNFTGCDLRDTFGANVIFDETTIFTDADIKGSIFNYYQDISKFADVDLEQQYQRLRSSYWGSICDWIARRVHNDVDQIDRAMAIRLFFDTKDLTVKTDILLRIKRLFKTSYDYRVFLVNIILREQNDFRAVRAAMQAASGIINSDIFLFKMILSYAKNAEFGLALALLSRLILSRFFPDYIEEIYDRIEVHSDYPLRALFLRRINGIYRYCRDEYIQVRDGQYIDYKDPIGFDDLARILDRNANRLARDRIQSMRGQNKMTEKKITQKVRLEVASAMLDGIRRFQNHGLFLVDAAYVPEDFVDSE